MGVRRKILINQNSGDYIGEVSIRAPWSGEISHLGEVLIWRRSSLGEPSVVSRLYFGVLGDPDWEILDYERGFL